MNPATGSSPFTARQEDLLQAAFRADAQGVACWHRWRASTDWEQHLPHDEFRLLPELYRNLLKLEIEDPLRARFKGVLRQSWAANQGFIQKVFELLHLLGGEPGTALLLAPTSLLVLDDTAIVSPMAPVRVALRPERVAPAIATLLGSGFKATWIRLPLWCRHGFVAAANALQLHQPEGMTLDLRWASAGQNPDRAISRVWEQAQPHTVGSQTIWLAENTSAIREMCSRPPVNGALAAAGDLLLYARNMATAGSPVSIEATTEWTMIGVRLRELLPQTFGLELVASTSGELVGEATSIAMNEQVHAREFPAGSTPSLGRRFSRHWKRYRAALGNKASSCTAWCHLPGYLQGLWGLSSPARVPLRFLRGLGYEWRLPPGSRHAASRKDP